MTDKHNTFRALHVPGQPFILANVWDVGSARMLAALGAKALATSSAAMAFVEGSADMGTISRDDALAHAETIVGATSLPVQGDFEAGFGDDPETMAETVRLAAEVGLSGICIEDMAYPANTAYDRDLAIERMRAAASAARALTRDFFFVARADGIMNGVYDIEEAIARVQGFEAAGVDGIYVPLPESMNDLARICAATTLPVNALAAGPYTKVSLAEYAAAGVARVSLGSALARATHRILHDASIAMLEDGDFSPLGHTISGNKIEALIAKGGAL